MPSDQAAQTPGTYRLRILVMGRSTSFVPGGEALSELVSIETPSPPVDDASAQMNEAGGS